MLSLDDVIKSSSLTWVQLCVVFGQKTRWMCPSFSRKGQSKKLAMWKYPELERLVEQKLAGDEGGALAPTLPQAGGKRPKTGDSARLILTDVTVPAHPSAKAGTDISTNQVFARVSIDARLDPRTLINVCKKGDDRKRESGWAWRETHPEASRHQAPSRPATRWH